MIVDFLLVHMHVAVGTFLQLLFDEYLFIIIIPSIIIINHTGNIINNKRV